MSLEGDKQESCVDLYTDGACSGNPGAGGWGCIMIYKGVTKTIKGNNRSTTNNQMEILAAINGLKSIKKDNMKIRVFTDSTYVKNGITEWINNWKARGWKTSARQDVKNKELWQELDSVSNGMDVEWHWVKAHSTNKYNNIADALAREAVSILKLEGKLINEIE